MDRKNKKTIEKLAQTIKDAENLKKMAQDQLLQVNEIHSRFSATLKRAIENLADANKIVQDSQRIIKECEEGLEKAKEQKEIALDSIQQANKVLGQWN